MFRQLSLRIVSVLVGLVAALIMSEVLLVVYGDFIASREKMDDGLIQYDATLGWTLARSWSGRHRHFDYDVRYSTGLSGLRDSTTRPANEMDSRVIVMGDSFTFGLGVQNGQTFVSRLNHLATSTTFINAGVPGYAPDQQLLWLDRVLLKTKATDILFVIYLGNDLIDIGLPFAVQAAYGKPFVDFDARGKLQVRNLPVPRDPKPPGLQKESLATYIMGEKHHDFWYNKFKISRLIAEAGMIEAYVDRNDRTIFQQSMRESMRERMRPSLRLFEGVLDKILSKIDQPFILVLLPGASVTNTPFSLSAQYQLLVGAELIQMAERKHIGLLDLTTALTGQPTDQYFAHDGHLTEMGHLTVASAIAGFLVE